MVEFYLDFSKGLPRQAKYEAITRCKDANTIANDTKMTEEGTVKGE